MKRLLITSALILLLTGCQMLGGLGSKITSLGDRFSNDNSSTIAAATATAGAVDRMSEIARREVEARHALEAQYEKFRQELAAAYANREKIDNENFDKISEVNYGIIVATEDVVGLDKRVLLANLKAKENSKMLMPIPEDIKKAIVSEIDIDSQKELAEIVKKYEQKNHEAVAAAKLYEKADSLVKKKEAEKAKLITDQANALKILESKQLAERERMLKESKDAVDIAKEKQRQEMVGMIVKALLAVSVLLLLIGFLMKSPAFIISGVSMLGLAYVAATIPFWIVAAIMGLFIVVMIVVNPKTGKIDFMSKKKAETPAAEPPPSSP